MSDVLLPDQEPATRGELRELRGEVHEIRGELALLRDLPAEVALLRHLPAEVALLRHLPAEVATFRQEFESFRTSTNNRFDTLAECLLLLRHELKSDITSAVNAAFERFQDAFRVLTDQNKSVVERQDLTDVEVHQVRDQLDTHRRDPGAHRRRR